MNLWQFSLIYLILGLVNVVFVIIHDPQIVYSREKIIIFSAFLFFPLFILFYLFTGIYVMLKLLAPAIWWILDKIADRGYKEDFGEDKLVADDNAGDDIYVKDDDVEDDSYDIVKCQTHCSCFKDRGL